MIRIVLRVDRQGSLASLESTGHAQKPGSEEASIACASVSVLLRSLGRLLERDPKIHVEGSAEAPGHFRIDVRRVTLRRRGYMRGVTESLLQGLQDVKRDFPDEIELIHNHKPSIGEKSHGA